MARWGNGRVTPDRSCGPTRPNVREMRHFGRGTSGPDLVRKNPQRPARTPRKPHAFPARLTAKTRCLRLDPERGKTDQIPHGPRTGPRTDPTQTPFVNGPNPARAPHESRSPRTDPARIPFVNRPNPARIPFVNGSNPTRTQQYFCSNSAIIFTANPMTGQETNYLWFTSFKTKPLTGTWRFGILTRDI